MSPCVRLYGHSSISDESPAGSWQFDAQIPHLTKALWTEGREVGTIVQQVVTQFFGLPIVRLTGVESSGKLQTGTMKSEGG